MTPIQKAKEITRLFNKHAYFSNQDDQFHDEKFDKWATTPQAAAILSGEDWKEDGWIEIKDGNKLPDYDEYVLWLHEDGNMHVEALDKDGNPWIFGEEFQGFTYPKATHWQPLPKAPQNE